MRTLLRALVLSTGLLIFFITLSAQQQVAKTISNSTSPDGLIGFLEFKPSDYGTQKHPLIIFLHGIGERGNGTSQINSVAANGTPRLCAAGASMRFTVNGQTSSFVVLSPQLSVQYGYWPTFYVKEMIKYAKANLQIDPNRIYIAGLSLGGGGVWRAITEVTDNDYSFDGTIAAAVPVCGTQEEIDANMCSTIAANHLPVWAFHSMDDGVVGVGCTQHAEILLGRCSGITPAPKFTYYQSGGHNGAWDNAFDTGHITRQVNVNGVVSNFTANPNVYEWLLSYSRNSSSAPQVSYTAPTSSAGSAQTITLPISVVTLTGSGTGTNGATISSYSWKQTSGPSTGVISTPLLNTTIVTGLVAGTYVFTLTVTDNHGLTSTSSVTITVNPLIANQAPWAYAGKDWSITLPTNNLSLYGYGGDPDGTIVSYKWAKTSGPSSYNIDNPNTYQTNVGNLVAGVYVFTLTVTDNGGATATSNITVTVVPAATNNQLPWAYAGKDWSITLPTNNLSLYGYGGDPDGTIVSYKWAKTSGPSSYNIDNPNTYQTNVGNLVAGVYVFTLTVTDNGGATATSNITVTVVPAATNNQLPWAYAGKDWSITLPTNNLSLYGYGGDPDGTIVSYKWAKTSGPSSYNIDNPNTYQTNVGNLVAGVYVFTLTVTDNGGATATSNITVTVVPTNNQLPWAYAGKDWSITLPTNNLSLYGYGGDPDGTIVSYKWAKTSGPSSYSIDNPNTYQTNVGNLVAGVYVFTLTVTDNVGGTATSNITVTVYNNSSQPLGYVKMAVSANAACADASTSGRIAVYGTGPVSNGTVLYTDAAKTQIFDGGWNWYSFTPTLGGVVTSAFAVYPIGVVFLQTSCSASSRSADTQTAASTSTLSIQQQQVTAADNTDSLQVAGKLAIYPNPVHTTATIELNSANSDTKIIYLYGTNGALIAKYTWPVVRGRNIYTLKNVASLVNGFYVIDVRNNSGISSGRLKLIKM
ncbi:MAG: T9SS type A sorting domain-containing protein [Chitinophagaceae bacterium]